VAAAQAVVDYRTAHGNFTTLADLKKVPGIDAARLDARKDRIAFR
jgi:competence ComEA-like helix-hairpin-helix protein